MMQQKKVYSVSADYVEFYPPEQDAYRLMRRYHIISGMVGVIIAGLFAAGGIWAVFHSEGATRLMILLIALALTALFVYLVYRTFRPLPYGVRFGTVMDHFSKSYGSGEDEHTDYYCTIRLDDTGELIHNLKYTSHLSTANLTGKQIMLSRQKRTYHIYDAQKVEHPVWEQETDTGMVWDSGMYADGTVRQAAAGGGEATIQDVQLYELPPDLYENIVRSRKSMNLIVLIILLAFICPFLGIVCVSFGRELFTYWYIALPIVAAVAALITWTAVKEMKREAHPALRGVPVQILSSHGTNPMHITFYVTGTGQTVVEQHIDYNYCGPHPDGTYAVLVRDDAMNYSIYPPDYHHR